MLDNVLKDYLSPKHRRLAHLILAIVLLVISALLTANGDWKQALISLAGTLYAYANKANTDGEIAQGEVVSPANPREGE